MKKFELASGTVPGATHFLTGKANQDAHHVVVGEDHVVAVVCDGCGEMGRSEIGAQFGARAIANIVVAERLYADDLSAERLLHSLTNSFVRELRYAMYSFGGVNRAVANEMFLFTVVVAIVGSRRATFAAFGDGLIAINGDITTLGPFSGNQPPYPVYKLVGSSLPESALSFRIVREMPTAELNDFAIGSDGVTDLAAAADATIPGREETVGPLSQFWTNDAYFTNHATLSRRLTVINGGVVRPVFGPGGKLLGKWPGLLSDDTTLVVGRRNK